MRLRPPVSEHGGSLSFSAQALHLELVLCGLSVSYRICLLCPISTAGVRAVLITHLLDSGLRVCRPYFMEFLHSSDNWGSFDFQMRKLRFRDNSFPKVKELVSDGGRIRLQVFDPQFCDFFFPPLSPCLADHRYNLKPFICVVSHT